MIAFSMTESQFNTITVPKTGKTRRGADVPLEGPVEITIDNPEENFATVELDPADTTGFTVRIASTISEQTPGDGPWLITGTLAVDGRVGAERKSIVVPYSVELTPSADAVSFAAAVGTARELPPPGTAARPATGAARPPR